MKKAAIVIDSYKLPVFEKRLRESGIEYDTEPGVTPNTLSLWIKANTMAELLQWRDLIAGINREATR
jgi:hypothetical protein